MLQRFVMGEENIYVNYMNFFLDSSENSAFTILASNSFMFIVYKVLRVFYWGLFLVLVLSLNFGREGQHEYYPIKVSLMKKLACLHDKREMNSIAISGTQNNIYSNVDKISLV